MNNVLIVLTADEWDRIIEILDYSIFNHPDKEFLLARILNQLVYTQSDIQEPLPISSTFSHPFLTPGEIIKDIIDNKKILADGIKAYDKAKT